MMRNFFKMLGFFRRTKLENWEVELLLNVINKTSEEIKTCLIHQIEEGLLRGVAIGLSDIEGYVAFAYNTKVYKKFYDKDGKNFQISHVKVFDVHSKSLVGYSIYVSHGLINGYRIHNRKKYKLDISSIDASNYQLIYLPSQDFELIRQLLTPEDQKFINPSDVYQVKLSNKTFFHIKDVEDGDFIALDEEGVLYKVTHDPYGVIILSDNLENILRH